MDNAQPGVDFIAETIPSTIIFQKGEQSKTFFIKSIGDNEKELDETFTITYRHP